MSLTSRDIGGDVPEAWVDAVNARLNDLYHDDLCACDAWPESCASGYWLGQWDGSTVTVMTAAVVLEPLIRARIAAEQSATVSTSQAAEIVGVSRATMVRFLDEGRLPYAKPGKHRRVLLADVLAFKAQTTHGAVP